MTAWRFVDPIYGFGLCAVIAVVYHLMPLLTRPEVYFAVTVPRLSELSRRHSRHSSVIDPLSGCTLWSRRVWSSLGSRCTARSYSR